MHTYYVYDRETGNVVHRHVSAALNGEPETVDEKSLIDRVVTRSMHSLDADRLAVLRAGSIATIQGKGRRRLRVEGATVVPFEESD